MTNVRSPAGSTLLDAWRPSLFSAGPPRPDDGFAQLVRRPLGDGAWVDHAPGWLSGSAEVFERLVQVLDWSVRQVTMYGSRLDEPRLTAGWPGPGVDPVAGPVVEQVRQTLSGRYGQHLGSTWANLYRDGHDSVAWHGDRILRQQDRSLVAIVSLGEPRPFRLRPRGGGPSVAFDLGGGDLLVMGGTCQRTWQHAVPKARRAGPRLSVSFRASRPGGQSPAVVSPMGQDTPVPPRPQ